MNAIAINAFSGEINQQQITLINAADLHAYLGVQTRFSDWILRRIEEYQFIVNQDFSNVRKLERVRNAFGFRDVEKTEYHLTLDMAKELCMVERSDVGRSARRYFIEMEKENRDAAPTWVVAQLSDAQAQLASTRAALLQHMPVYAEILRYKSMLLNHTEIARLLQSSTSVVRKQVRQLEALGYLIPPHNLAQLQASQRTNMVKLAHNQSAGV